MLHDNQAKSPAGTSDPTITIARRHLANILATVFADATRGHRLDRRTSDAFKSFIASGLPAVDDDTPVTLPAERAYWLLHGSDALAVYQLDETADATYEHPAVVAENEIQNALMDQAAELYERLSAITTAELDWPPVTRPGSGSPEGGAR